MSEPDHSLVLHDFPSPLDKWVKTEDKSMNPKPCSQELARRFVCDALHAMVRAQNDLVVALSLLGDEDAVKVVDLAHSVDVARINTVLADWKA